MALFAKKKTDKERMAISFQDDGASAACIKASPGGRPVVELLAFCAGNRSAPLPALERLAKEWHADEFLCSSLLSAGEYQLLSVDAPNVPQHELKTAIRWRLKDMLDFHVDDATIDVLSVPMEKEAAGRVNSMYVVAARNQVIAQCQLAFEQAKIPLTAIDIPEMAQRNIAALMEPPGYGLALLSFDGGGGLLTITYGGELFLARRVDVSLPQTVRADAEQQAALHERITLEVQRSLDHFDRQYRHISLAKLVLFPLGSSGVPLQTYLATNLYVPVDIMTLESVLDISKVPELNQLESQQRHFLTLGAALRHEEIVP